MPGVVLHPQPCVRMAKAHKRSHHRRSRNIDIPCAMAYRLIFALSSVSMTFFSHRRQQIIYRLSTSPGVPGPHAFAVRINRARRTRCRVHRIPRPTLVTIAKRPLARTGRRDETTYFRKTEVRNFRAVDWTPSQLLNRLTKFDFSRTHFWLLQHLSQTARRRRERSPITCRANHLYANDRCAALLPLQSFARPRLPSICANATSDQKSSSPLRDGH
jgi:hypothetical protein